MKSCRLILLFTLVAIAFFGCKKKQAPIVIVPDVEKNHLQNNRIFGDVKFLNTKTYYLLADSLSLSDTANIADLVSAMQADISDCQQYTSDGYLLSYHKCNSANDTVLRRTYTYSDDAKVTGWEEFDRDCKPTVRGVYTYDRNRYPSREQIFRGDSLVMDFMHTTDGIGNIIRTQQSNSDFSNRIEYKYNELGLVSELVEYEPNGKVFKTAKIEYDNYGDEVNRCVYKSGNQMIEYTYTKYDPKGRNIQTIYEDRLHNLKEYHYFSGFDANNNWKYEVCAVDGHIVFVKVREIIYY